MRNGLVVATLNSFDNIEIVEYGGRIIKVCEGFVCESLEYNPYTEFVHVIVCRRDKYKSEGKTLLRTLANKLAKSVYGSNVRRDILDKYVCVTVEWMAREYDSSVKGINPSENGNFINKNTYTKVLTIMV